MKQTVFFPHYSRWVGSAILFLINNMTERIWNHFYACYFYNFLEPNVLTTKHRAHVRGNLDDEKHLFLRFLIQLFSISLEPLLSISMIVCESLSMRYVHCCQSFYESSLQRYHMLPAHNMPIMLDRCCNLFLNIYLEGSSNVFENINLFLNV